MPFIAITEKAFARLVNEQYEVLQRGIAVQRRLEQLVLESAGCDEVARALSAAIGGTIVMLDGQGDEMARRELPPRAAAGSARGDPRGGRRAQRRRPRRVRSSRRTSDVAGRALALPVAAERARRPAGLAGRRSATRAALGEFERLILQQAVTVVALELMRRRVVRDTERRLAGDILAEAVDGRARRAELRRPAAPVRRRAAGGGAGLRGSTTRDARRRRSSALLVEAGVRARWSPPATGCSCAVVDGAGEDPVALAAQARDALAREHGDGARGGQPRRRRLGTLRRCLPRGALRARGRPRCSTAARPTSPPGATWARSSSCSSVQDDEALRALLRQRARARSRTARASTAASCCARWRPSSSTTASGSAPPGSSSATGTRCATGSGASSS